MEALLDRVQGGPPVADDLATRFEALGYSSWAYRVINTAGAPHAALALGEPPVFGRPYLVLVANLPAAPCLGDPQCLWAYCIHYNASAIAAAPAWQPLCLSRPDDRL